MSTLLKTMRIPFLVLAPACVTLGLATALQSGVDISAIHLVLIFLGALSAHVSVNTFNEYFDFHSGLDAITQRTPFSGGSGALVADPGAHQQVLYLAVASLVFSLLIGVYFVMLRGWQILPVGLVGVATVATYTQLLNRNPWLSWSAPGLGFGPSMVIGTHIALGGDYSMTSLAASLVPFFLTNNLLLLNQYPDLEADSRVGRRHFLVAYGVDKGVLLYGLSVALAILVIVLGVWRGLFPILAYLSLLPVSAAVVAFLGLRKYGRNIEKLMPYMGMNVLAAVLTPLLFGVTLMVAT